jgi:hypothetical protein
MYGLLSYIVYALFLNIAVNYYKQPLFDIFSRPIVELLTILLLVFGYQLSKKFYLTELGNRFKEKRLLVYLHYIAYMTGAVLVYLTAISIIEKLT